MRNKEKEQIPLFNIERNPAFLLVSVLISALISLLGYVLLKNVNPWGFLVMIPAAILSFQSVWFLLNPFAVIFEDKIEIKQSLFHHKDHYFIDIKKITKNKNGRLYITYKDDEVELIRLFGIKTSHRQLLKSEVEKFISVSTA
ncbi:MAG TPA: hypothetical protein PL029_08665 [Bacteroidia bacterium]|nr:hypothetical protein [Bacteroidia bacterium]